MQFSDQWISEYLTYCEYQKGLSSKTLKAYRIDLQQFGSFMKSTDGDLSRTNLNCFITFLHRQYKPKSIKRKIASIKAFCSHLEFEELVEENPFTRIRTKIQEPFILPRTIPLSTIEAILVSAYQQKDQPGQTHCQLETTLRDIAVLELLFATGIRVSELCLLKRKDVNLAQGEVIIYGKGSKERILQIENTTVLKAIQTYYDAFRIIIESTGYFFLNRLNRQLSEQSVRLIINKYAKMAKIDLHITPHMFRHSFATLLLEEDVDIRYIQKLLGHSSITTTQIYTHVASKKQRDILLLKHPRNKIKI